MSFARSLFTVSSLTVISRIAGFIRDTLTAMLLGAGPIADAYFVAQRLPNLFRSLFAEGAFSAAFVPLYTSEQQKNGDAAAQSFAAEALAMLMALLIPFTILMIIFMPLVITVLAPGFQDEPEKFATTILFSRIAFPYLILISVTALQGGVLNARNRFGPAAAAPIAYNLVLIVALLASKFVPDDTGLVLSWAVTLAGIVQMIWLGISCRKAYASIAIILPKLTDRTIKLFKQVGPGALGAGATQINIMLSTILASTLPTGAISYLFYADRLNQLPLGIVGIAVATTLLPVLSKHVAAGEEDNVRHYISRAIEFCLMLGLPATIGLSLIAQPIIQTLFEHGAFTHTDTVETANALAAYSLSIPGFLLVKVLSAGFFARQDTKTPVKVALVAMATNVVFSLLLLGPMQHVGIALATSIATWTNALLLYSRLLRDGGKLSDAKLLYRVPRLVLSAFGMSVIAIGSHYLLRDNFIVGDLWHKAFALTVIIGSSGIGYALLLQITNAMRWRDALTIIKR